MIEADWPLEIGSGIFRAEEGGGEGGGLLQISVTSLGQGMTEEDQRTDGPTVIVILPCSLRCMNSPFLFLIQTRM
jgi:hypothetical protein